MRPSRPPDTRRHLRAGARPSTQTLSPSREVSSPPVRVRRTATANPRDEVQPSDASSGECVCGREWLRQDREELMARRSRGGRGERRGSECHHFRDSTLVIKTLKKLGGFQRGLHVPVHSGTHHLARVSM